MPDKAAEIFFDHFGLVPDGRPGTLVPALSAAFTRLPYENVSKLLAKYDSGTPRLRRLPERVMLDHLAFGTGGTCFSLSALFAAVLDRAGVRLEHLLCDSGGRSASHCALLVSLGEERLLLDPAYLLAEPQVLPSVGGPPSGRAEGRVQLSSATPGCYTLSTFGRARYSFRACGVSREHFERVWEQSFAWTMMNDVHLSRAEGEGYCYAHGHKLRVHSREGKQTFNLRGEEAPLLAAHFGIDPVLVARAFELVRQARLTGRP